MTSREKLTFERMKTLLDVIEDSAYSPSGEIPPEYAREIKQMQDLDRGRELRQSHRNGNGPP